MSFESIAAGINRELESESTMEVGKIVRHPKGYRVKIISGQFLDPTYGRVSNWWTWKRVRKGGKLGRAVSGYGW